MTEKQLIENLIGLREIKPNQDWVALTKKSILGSDSILEKIDLKDRILRAWDTIIAINYKAKLAYSFAVLLLAVVGTIGLAQNAVPGDMLFSVRKTTEKIQLAFGNNDASKYNFEIANKRLEDLVAVVKDNRTQNIAPSISAFKASMADATQSVIDSLKKDPKTIEEIVAEVKKIKENYVLLDKIGGSDLQSTSDQMYKAISQEEIAALERVTLTEEQEKILKEIKELFDAEKYSDAFEKILTINN